MYRGTDIPDDIASIQRGTLTSHAQRQGAQENFGFLARWRHTYKGSTRPPSAYVSVTRKLSKAEDFARGKEAWVSPPGKVFAFGVRRGDLNRSWYSYKPEGEYLARGGTQVFNVRELEYIPW